MKRLLITLIFSFSLTGLACSSLYTTKRPDIVDIMNNATWEHDPGLKILEVRFKRLKNVRNYKRVASYVKVKSCYTMKVSCDITSQWHPDKETHGKANGLLFKSIEKESNAEDKGVIKIYKDDILPGATTSIVAICTPIYQEHPDYPPDDKYWDQFLPNKKECRN